MKAEKLNNELIDFAETMLDDKLTLVFRMQGYSMYPTLKNGDRGHVEKCTADNIKIGDILVFKSNDKLIAHRLMSIRHENGVRLFIAKGDKNFHFDPPFTEKELIGKVISVEHKKPHKKNRTDIDAYSTFFFNSLSENERFRLQFSFANIK
jgi:signal peptidase I